MAAGLSMEGRRPILERCSDRRDEVTLIAPEVPERLGVGIAFSVPVQRPASLVRHCKNRWRFENRRTRRAKQEKIRESLTDENRAHSESIKTLQSFFFGSMLN
jgi:hypothetical protein